MSREIYLVPVEPNQETYQVDTSNVLFILSGAFVGLDKAVKKRIAKGVRFVYCQQCTLSQKHSQLGLAPPYLIETRMTIISSLSLPKMVKPLMPGDWWNQPVSSSM